MNRIRRDRDGFTAEERHEVERYLAHCTYRYAEMNRTLDRIAHKIDRMTDEFTRLASDVSRRIGSR